MFTWISYQRNAINNLLKLIISSILRFVFSLQYKTPEVKNYEVQAKIATNKMSWFGDVKYTASFKNTWNEIVQLILTIW